MQEFVEIWSLVLNELGKGNAETVVNLWFKEISLLGLTETEAYLWVPNNFKRRTVKSNFSRQISSALAAVIGYEVELVFTESESDVPTLDTVSAAEQTPSEEPAENTKPVSEAEPSFFSTVSGFDEVKEEEKEPDGVKNEAFSAHSTGYTFDNFIVGSSNRFAHAACISVAKNPAQSYNPLFIYGPSGLGKTHLLYAIINEIHKNIPESNIIYVKGEEFTNQMIESISKGKTAEFRQKFRKADVLLIDDIHFIAGKEATQEEFFHTFNDLYENKKQIILTSDRPAKDIQHLEDRLRTRFDWGLAADIQPPDFELRIAIMRQKAEMLGLPFPSDVLEFLADRLTNNVRQLEGAIKRIIAYSRLNGEAVTVSLVNTCISDLLSSSGAAQITPKKIISYVAEKYGVAENDIYSSKRTSNIAKARHICIYIMRKMLDASYPAMGKLLNRDHTSILSSYKTIEKEIKNDSFFEIEINELIKELNS